MKIKFIIGYKPIDNKIELKHVTIKIADSISQDDLNRLSGTINSLEDIILIHPEDARFTLYSYLAELNDVTFIKHENNITSDEELEQFITGIINSKHVRSVIAN